MYQVVESATSLSSRNIKQQTKEETALKRFDPQIVLSYRAYCKAINNKPQMSKFRFSANAEHMLELVKTAKQAEENIQLLIEQGHTQLTPLFKEIKRCIKDNDVTPLWMRGICFRVQAGISTITDDERDFLSHTFSDGEARLEGLTVDEAWKNPRKSMHFVEKYIMDVNTKISRNVRDFYESDRFIDGNFVQHIRTILEKKLPAAMYYPIFKESVLDIAFLTESFLDSVYPIGMPSDSVTVHGTTLSPLSFSIHDYLHGEIDEKFFSILGYTLSLIDKHMIESTISSDTLVDLTTQYAAQKSAVVIDALKEIFQAIRGDKKALTGMFLLVHEFSSFNTEMFAHDELLPALRAFVRSSIHNEKGKLYDLAQWHSPSDPLNTSPFTGETELNDALLVATLKSSPQISAHFQRGDYGVPAEESIRSEPKVNRTKRFIDIEFETKVGTKTTFQFPTLHHKWSNIDGEIGLLKDAGITIEKPVLGTDPKKARKQTIDFLQDVQWELGSCITHFYQKASEVIQKEEESTSSLEKRYEEKCKSLKGEYEVQILQETIKNLDEKSEALKKQYGK